MVPGKVTLPAYPVAPAPAPGQRQRLVDQAAQPAAVGRQVVAADQRDRAGVGRGPGGQPAHQQAGHGTRGRSVARSAAARRPAAAAGGRVEPVRLLGDGQRDHPDRRVGEQRHHRVRVARRVPDPGQRADHPGVGAGRRPSVVTLNRSSCAASASTSAGASGARPRRCPSRRRPRPIAVLGVDGLVGAVERAQSEVDDAGRHGARPDPAGGSAPAAGAGRPGRAGRPAVTAMPARPGSENSAIDAGLHGRRCSRARSGSR